MEKLESKKSRDINADVLKIIACFLVIMNHTSVPFSRFNGVSFSWILATGLFFISKIAVPIFLLITGMFIFDQERGYKYSLNKFSHFGILLLIWNYLYWILKGNASFFYRIDRYFIDSWRAPNSTHLWYLYTLVGFYMMLPVLEKMIAKFNQYDFKYYIFLWLVFSGILPMLYSIFKIENLTSYLQVNIFIGFIGFFIIGKYLSEFPLKKIQYFALFSLGLISSILVTVFFTNQTKQAYLGLDNVLFLPLVMTSIGFYGLFRNFNMKFLNVRLQTLFSKISSLTLGIYLLHIFVIGQVLKISFISRLLNQTGFKLILVYLIFDISIFIISGVISWILKKIPIFNKLVS